MKIKQKDMIEKALECGMKAYGTYHNAPCMNPEFMATVPNYGFDDEKGCKLRIKMYKAYIKGWTLSHLKTMEI